MRHASPYRPAYQRGGVHCPCCGARSPSALWCLPGRNPDNFVTVAACGHHREEEIEAVLKRRPASTYESPLSEPFSVETVWEG